MKRALLFTASLLFLACQPATATCVGGQSIACTGPGACAGRQICGPDGTFGACVCDGLDGGERDAATPFDDASPDAASFCGDTRVGPGEACDDGNLDACDGCDACEARHALRFSEDGTRMDVAGSEASTRVSELTVEYWFRLAPGPGLPEAVSVGTRTATGGWALSVGASSVAFGTATVTNTHAPARTLLDGAWHHVAWVHSSATSQHDLYLDGRAVLAVEPTLAPGGTLVVGPLFGGAAFDDYRGGEIDELRVSRVARYAIAFTPARRFDADVDTVALYHFDEGEGTVAGDDSPLHRDGAYVGPVAFADEGRFGTCLPTLPVEVQDVSSRPIAFTLAGHAFTVDGLSSIGVEMQMVETPLPDGRTHKVPDRARYRDITLRGLRGASADVAWLASWVAASSPIDGQVALVETGGATSTLPMLGLRALRGTSTPMDEGGGRARLEEVVVSVTGFGPLVVVGDENALRLPCGSPVVGLEIEGVLQAAIDPATLASSPVPFTSDPIVIRGLSTCRDAPLDIAEVRQNADLWMRELLSGTVDRKAMSMIGYRSSYPSTEVIRDNAYECLPARIDYFDASLPYGTGSTFTIEIVNDRAERA